MRLVNLDGADSVQHPEHGHAAAGPDGVFDVPTELGQALLKHRGQWTTEAEHVAAAERAKLHDLADPHKAPHILLDLRTRLEAAEARIEQLEHAATEPAQDKKLTAAEKRAAAKAKAETDE